MKKIFSFLIVSLFITGFFFVPAMAEDDIDFDFDIDFEAIPIDDPAAVAPDDAWEADWEDDYDYGDWEDLDWGDFRGMLGERGMAEDWSPGFGFGFLAMGWLSILISVAAYIYMALALMTLAKKLNTHPAWLAWIPIANLYLMSKMAQMHWWPILLLIAMIIPLLNFLAMIALLVFVIIWQWKIFERVNRPGWWALMILIPFVGAIIYYVLLGIAAWGKPAKKSGAAPEQPGPSETGPSV